MVLTDYSALYEDSIILDKIAWNEKIYKIKKINLNTTKNKKTKNYKKNTKIIKREFEG